jgi:hypothetical protein
VTNRTNNVVICSRNVMKVMMTWKVSMSEYGG